MSPNVYSAIQQGRGWNTEPQEYPFSVWLGFFVVVFVHLFLVLVGFLFFFFELGKAYNVVYVVMLVFLQPVNIQLLHDLDSKFL